MNRKMFSSPTGRAQAFTLVELLVVIGIIALLISVLLPSLNKARQQANLIKCQSNLRTIGQALSIYTAERKGQLPMGMFNRDTTTPDNGQTQWNWAFELGSQLNKNMISGRYILPTTGLPGVDGLSKAFEDVDTIEGGARQFVQHYTANPRVLYTPYDWTFGSAQNPQDIFRTSLSRGRKSSDVKQSAAVFVIWDGPQATGSINDVGGLDYNSPFVAQGIDGYGIYYTGLCYDNNDANGVKVALDLPIQPTSGGDPGDSDGRAAQKQNNVDVNFYTGGGSPPWQSLRFRHLKNTTLNALCLDGHVEVRRVGTVLRRDIYTNVP